MKTRAMIKTRKIAAALVFIGFILVFCFGSLPGLEKLPKLQIGPAILAGSLAIIITQLVAALLFGRIYCSILCPLGILQEGIANIPKKGKRRTMPHSKWLRMAILGIFAASLASGYLFFFNALDPYSTFGRIAAGIFTPILGAVNNLCASVLAYLNLPLLLEQRDLFNGWPILLAAIAALTLLAILALNFGRIW